MAPRSVATSVELDGMDLQVMAPRPVLEFALGCPLTQVAGGLGKMSPEQRGPKPKLTMQ